MAPKRPDASEPLRVSAIRLGVALVVSLGVHVLIWNVVHVGGGGAGGEAHLGLQATLLPAGGDEARRPRPVAHPGVAHPAPIVAPKRAHSRRAGGPSPRAGVSLPVPDGAIFYPLNVLDVRPRPREPINPVYPPGAANTSGTVTLLLWVDEHGVVVKESVVKAVPKGIFDQSVLDAFGHAGTRPAFYPAQKDGRDVASRFLVRVRFTAVPPSPVPGVALGPVRVLNPMPH
ncbi:MAG: TonB family protein [Betaproteobacteria bacterium]|nr:TonB family protein [Betaproteobacteria bacterium]